MSTQIRIAAIAFLLLMPLSSVNADTLVYGFDDGTFGNWQLVDIDGNPLPDDGDVIWAPSNAPIDIGDGFTLLPATSGDYRVVPDPWENRDCLGGLFCYTEILRSPEFFLDDSGELTVDMIGGGANGDQPFDPNSFEAPAEPSDLFETKAASGGLQGYALLDTETNQYVLHGFSSAANDGKARADDPPERGEWETVALTQEELAPFANNGKAYRVDVFDSYLGGWGWIGFDTVTIPGRATDAGLPGDVNLDSIVDDKDIDDLSLAVKEDKMDGQYDVNSDGQVNDDDRTYWVKTINNTYFGDANLDGEFNSGDFVQVFTAGKYNKEEMAGWAQGDWDGNMIFDSGDFVAAFTDGGYELGPAALSVPEPTSSALLLCGLSALMLVHTARRRSS